MPGMFSVATPEAFIDACTYESGFTILYEDSLVAGLRLPLHPLARNLLIHLGIAPGQLASNSWRFLIGAAYLWPQTFGYEMSLSEFLWAYRPFSLVGELGFFLSELETGEETD